MKQLVDAWHVRTRPSNWRASNEYPTKPNTVYLCRRREGVVAGSWGEGWWHITHQRTPPRPPTSPTPDRRHGPRRRGKSELERAGRDVAGRGGVERERDEDDAAQAEEPALPCREGECWRGVPAETENCDRTPARACLPTPATMAQRAGGEAPR